MTQHPIYGIEILGETDSRLAVYGRPTKLLFSYSLFLAVCAHDVGVRASHQYLRILDSNTEKISMVSFAAACCLLFLVGTTLRTRIPLGVSCVCILALIVWCTYTIWYCEYPWFRQFINALPDARLKRLLKGCLRTQGSKSDETDRGKWETGERDARE
jgi:hypothetical protein